MALEYSKSTDSEHKIKLDSKFIYAAWRTGFAPAGQSVEFEVMTAFVGNGASIKVKGKSQGGENLGNIDSKIKNNKFIGSIDIPEDAEIGDLVYFEVKLPKNGLSGESNKIPVTPPITVTNMKWSEKEARRGDVLTLSADVSGCVDETEAKITIYEYDSDKVHDRIVELPARVKEERIEIQWEYEYHEDVDEIPTEEELEKYGRHYNHPEYFFIIEINGQKFGKEQESGILKFKDWIELHLTKFGGSPLPNEKYVFRLADGSKREGNFDNDGYAREENIPPGSVQVDIPDYKLDAKADDNKE
jgi:hypothetical protein